MYMIELDIGMKCIHSLSVNARFVIIHCQLHMCKAFLSKLLRPCCTPLVHIFSLYALASGNSYNTRAISTLAIESFFSDLA